MTNTKVKVCVYWCCVLPVYSIGEHWNASPYTSYHWPGWGIGGRGQGYALIGMLGCDLTYRFNRYMYFLLSQRLCEPQDAGQQYTPFS